MLGELRGWSHELGGPTLHSGEGNMLNELAWALGMGRLGDITHHPPIYIGGCLEANDHHSINMSSIKEFCSAWMSPHDRPNSGEKLVQKSRVRNSGEKLVQKTRVKNSCRKLMQKTRVRSFRQDMGEVVQAELRQGHSGRTQARSFRQNSVEVVGQENRARSFGQPR